MLYIVDGMADAKRCFHMSFVNVYESSIELNNTHFTAVSIVPYITHIYLSEVSRSILVTINKRGHDISTMSHLIIKMPNFSQPRACVRIYGTDAEQRLGDHGPTVERADTST